MTELDDPFAEVRFGDFEAMVFQGVVEQGFLGGQVEFATNLRQKLLDDAKVFADLSASFKADLDKLTEENVSELTEKATKAVVITPAKPAAAPAPVAAAPAPAPAAAPAASKKAAATGGSAA